MHGPSAQEDQSSVVRLLLIKLGADGAIDNKNDDAAFDLATLNGQISEFKCSSHVKLRFDHMLLHMASHLDIVKKPVSEQHHG